MIVSEIECRFGRELWIRQARTIDPSRQRHTISDGGKHCHTEGKRSGYTASPILHVGMAVTPTLIPLGVTELLKAV